jgi:hypothetical protein
MQSEITHAMSDATIKQKLRTGPGRALSAMPGVRQVHRRRDREGEQDRSRSRDQQAVGGSRPGRRDGLREQNIFSAGVTKVGFERSLPGMQLCRPFAGQSGCILSKCQFGERL